jgi:plasmid replication initiation protein
MIKTTRRPDKRKMRLIAWMRWAAYYVPGTYFADRDALIAKLMKGLTAAEREEVARLDPIYTHRIVRQPGRRR